MKHDFTVIYLNPDRIRGFACDYNPVVPCFLEKFPPQLDDAKRFVRGDRVEILNLLELGAPVPVSGPVVTTSGLSGENG